MRETYICPLKSVYVVTEDTELLKGCQEALRPWDAKLIAATNDENGWNPSFSEEADLCVWDCRNRNQQPPQRRKDIGKCIFVADRKSLAELPKENLLFAAAVVLLPVDTVHLNVAFEQAFARQHSITALQYKDEKDALLQCFLQANLKLQQHDQDRTNFLNRALHDFRAPLTSISGYCGLLLDGQTGALTPEQAKTIQRIQNSAKRLARLSEGMFHLGVRRVTQLLPELTRGDIFSVVDTAAGEVDSFAQPKQVAISVNLDEPRGELLFEHERITQLIVNLLENACRYSPKESVIQIKGYSYFWERRLQVLGERRGLSERRSRRDARPNCYRIDISDCGIGILPEHLGSIFEEYTSYSGGKDRSGTGLGLAISKDIAESHSGCIWAESRSTGATFSFVLPYCAALPAQSEAAIAACATN